MFDKLIESEPEGADFKNRRGFFVVSTVVVGILFLTAVVISIYAEDFALGNDRMELEAMLAPVEMTATEPEPPRPRPVTPTHEQSVLPIRQVNMSTTSEPTIVPTSTSVVPNTMLSRPEGKFELGSADTNPIGDGRTDQANGPGSIANAEAPTVVEKEPIPEPPPVRDPAPVKPPPIKSIGVANGRATYLPKPPYPSAAIALHIEGKVDVQIMIDESGKVISANAINGNPLLRNAAEQAARGARFTPTLLSLVPIKVTGVIVYNFNRN